jgi:asparagine synthase (glutamine-hydrolysing)
MSAISGFWNVSGSLSEDELQSTIDKMSQKLIHRGNHQGSWFDVKVGLAFGGQELPSIVNFNQACQPLTSINGRYVIVLDGRLDNDEELRHQLQELGYPLRSNSYAELILALVTHWGISQGVTKCKGFFAFAIWDRQEQLLHLVRDQIGKKPMYYALLGKTLMFGSELKALKVHPHFVPTINRNAIALFLRYNYIPCPYSIYESVFKLPPATILTFDGVNIQTEPYWFLKDVIQSSINDPFTGSEKDAIEEMEQILNNAIHNRIKPHQKAGAFLSGGLDSTTIVTLMQKQSNQKIKTFTLGLHDQQENEAEYAQATAQYLGTDHTEIYINDQDALDLIPQLPSIYDEPFGDISQIPSLMISKIAKTSVDIILTGDGGDEIFFADRSKSLSYNLGEKITKMPKHLRQILSKILNVLASSKLGVNFNFLESLSPQLFKHNSPQERLKELQQIFSFHQEEYLYQYLSSIWKSPVDLVLNSVELQTAFSNSQYQLNLPNFIQNLIYFDLLTWLPDDILVKVDRSSMAFGLETRMPFLDQNIVKLAWKLPLSYHLCNGQGKRILRQILAKNLPKELIERPKMGFGIPSRTWLREPLRDWAQSLLEPTNLAQQGFFNEKIISQKWEEHLSGKRNWEHYLWGILMFQQWLNSNSKA